MKNFNEFNKGLPITETILLGRSVQMGDRRGRIVKVVSVGETSRWDTIYKVKFQDGTQVEMHDAQIRPFLIEKSGAGEEATDELDDTYRKDTPGEEEEVEEAFGLDTIKAFIEDVAKKLKMDKFSRSERARLKRLHKEAHWYNVHILGISESVDEDAPTNAVGGGMSPHFGGEGEVQGYDPQLGQKKKRKKFAGAEVFELSSDEYNTCMHGRKKYERWNRKLNMEDIDNQDIRSYAHKNPGKPIVIQDKITGIMSYLIHGDKK